MSRRPSRRPTSKTSHAARVRGRATQRRADLPVDLDLRALTGGSRQPCECLRLQRDRPDVRCSGPSIGSRAGASRPGRSSRWRLSPSRRQTGWTSWARATTATRSRRSLASPIATPHLPRPPVAGANGETVEPGIGPGDIEFERSSSSSPVPHRPAALCRPRAELPGRMTDRHDAEVSARHAGEREWHVACLFGGWTPVTPGW